MTTNAPIGRDDEFELQSIVEAAWEDRDLLRSQATRQAIDDVLTLLDRGALRVAEKVGREWLTRSWVKKALILKFPMAPNVTESVGPFEWRDKIPLKRGLEAAGVRAVPGSVVRYSAFVESGAVLMPSFVNIGSRVGSGTMIDTWATVGSCAQVGRNCHVAGGVGIGGVLEPPSANPVIVEDHCFLGSRCIVVEGVIVEEGAVLGANVVLTSSTSIVDVTGPQEVVTKGRVPANAVVIPGTRTKGFPAGSYGVPCALVIGKRTESTDRKTSLNEALRDFGIGT